MAPLNPPAYLQAGTYPARFDRLALSALLTPRSSSAITGRPGVFPGRSAAEELLVHQRTTPDMQVTVDPGVMALHAVAAAGGVYVCTNDAAYHVALTAAHASLPRKDIIVGRIYDAVDDSGSLNEWGIEAVTGTAAASPSAPSVPSNAIQLAEIAVAANATTITNANITDKRIRTVARGGILPVTSTALPSGPYAGQSVYATDTKEQFIWDGTGWKRVLDENYGFAYGTLATLFGDADPDLSITTTTESAAGAKVNVLSGLSFTVPAGVPATRRIYAVLSINVARASGSAYYSLWLDGAQWFIGRRIGVTLSGGETHDFTAVRILTPPAAGAHTVDLRIWNEDSSDTTLFTSGNLSILLL